MSVLPLTAQDNTTECEAEFRLFDHELLATDPVCIPENPERIVMLENFGIEFMLLLDVTPAAYAAQVVDLSILTPFPQLQPQVEQVFGDIPDAGFSPPNIEIIVEAQPDLIVLYDFFIDLEDQLNIIAPTIFVSLVPGQGLTIQNMADFHSQLWAPEAELNELITTYETRASELGEAINQHIDGKSVVIGRMDGASDAGVTLFAASSAYAVLNDAGWEPAPDFAERLASVIENFPYSMEPITYENLETIDGDFLILYDLSDPTYDPEINSEQVEMLINHPLFNTLDVVQREQVYITEAYWNNLSLVSLHAIVDDLWQIFGDDEPTIPNPFSLEVLVPDASN